MEAAGGVRLREQPVHGVHADRHGDRGREPRRRSRVRVRAGQHPRRRQRRGRDVPHRSREPRPGAQRRRPVAHRGAHLPKLRSFACRSGQVPAGRGGRRLEGGTTRSCSTARGLWPAASAKPTSTRSRRPPTATSRPRPSTRRHRPHPERTTSCATCGRMEDRHGGTDLSRRGRSRDHAGDGARSQRRLPRRGRRRRRRASSRRRSGCSSASGPERVRDTPISEQAILGAAMGAAMTGLRPIAEIMFADFFAVCWDLVANQIAKSSYMTAGQVSFPAGHQVRQRRRSALRCAALPVGRELGDGGPRAQGRGAVESRPT